MSNQYKFLTQWRLKAGIDEVSEILDDPLGLARWWPSVYLEVSELEPGDPVTHVGRYIELYTKGWLPYTLIWTAEVVKFQPPTFFEIKASGDFVGRGVWNLKQNGAITDVRFEIV